MKVVLAALLIWMIPLSALGTSVIDPVKTIVYVNSQKIDEITRMVDRRSGTGFVVEDGYILTAAHVVHEPGPNQSTTISVSFGSRANPSYRVELVDLDQWLDLALLALPEHIDLKVAPIPAGDSHEVERNARLLAYGFPKGSDLSSVDGILSSKTSPRGRWQTSVTFYPGYSGGPILNSKNEWVAVAIAGDLDRQAITYAVPEAYTRRIRIPAQKKSQAPEAVNALPVRTMDVLFTALADSEEELAASVQRSCLPEGFKVVRVEQVAGGLSTSVEVVEGSPNCFDVRALSPEAESPWAQYQVLGVQKTINTIQLVKELDDATKVLSVNRELDRPPPYNY